LGRKDTANITSSISTRKTELQKEITATTFLRLLHSAAILKLLSACGKALLVCGNAQLNIVLRLDIANSL
jgi:hypothetical protein